MDIIDLVGYAFGVACGAPFTYATVKVMRTMRVADDPRRLLPNKDE